jgi:hypothetical protein
MSEEMIKRFNKKQKMIEAAKNATMDMDKVITQLDSLIGNSSDFIEEPDDIWSHDITALEIAKNALWRKGRIMSEGIVDSFDKEEAINFAKSATMSVDRAITQLNSLISNSADFVEKPDDIWLHDITALEMAKNALLQLKSLEGGEKR